MEAPALQSDDRPGERNESRSFIISPLSGKQGRRPPWLRYGVALVSVASACSLQVLFFQLMPQTPFLLFYPTICLACWFGGKGPGFLATGLSALLAWYFFIPPVQSLALPNLGSGLAILLFTAMGVAITLFTQLEHDLKGSLDAQIRISEQNRQRLQLALMVGKIGVWEMDLQSPRISWSQRQYEIFDIDPSMNPLTYEAFEKTLHPEDIENVKREFSAALHEGRDFNLNYRIRTRSGEVRWVKANGRVIRDERGEPIRMIGTNLDITERFRSETRLQQALKTREELMAVVSHDLRNPLGAILMNAALLKRSASRSDPFALAQAEKIQRAGERMNDMIEDLLNLAKIEAGTYSLSKRETCGCSIIHEAIDLIHPLAEQKKIRIQTEGVDEPLQIGCDHSQLLRVFSNLLGNAVKFTPEHGVILIKAEDRGEEVTFSVTDSGPGIAEHHLPNVFDRYWRASQNMHQGTGLGLAIAKGIVEAHGGKIWVKSRFGHGATFSLSLPKASAAAASSEVA